MAIINNTQTAPIIIPHLRSVVAYVTADRIRRSKTPERLRRAVDELEAGGYPYSDGEALLLAVENAQKKAVEAVRERTAEALPPFLSNYGALREYIKSRLINITPRLLTLCGFRKMDNEGDYWRLNADGYAVIYHFNNNYLRVIFEDRTRKELHQHLVRWRSFNYFFKMHRLPHRLCEE